MSKNNTLFDLFMGKCKRSTINTIRVKVVQKKWILNVINVVYNYLTNTLVSDAHEFFLFLIK
jgi:hypothetical protein